MRLGALFSGGKDSTYAMYSAMCNGHSVECLISMIPESDESMLFHHPNIWVTELQSHAIGIPRVAAKSLPGDPMHEAGGLADVIYDAKLKYGINGIVHGGIRSIFQSRHFMKACRMHDLEVIAPLWQAGGAAYMRRLINEGFECMITGVSAGGLDQRWLGRVIDADALDDLERLAIKFGFSVDFEGGEAETLVVCCPAFSRRIRILRSDTIWDGVRGRFEIREATLEDRA